MAKEKPMICPKCKVKLFKNEAINHNNRYFHPECFEEKGREDEEKKLHAEHYKSLIEYICNIYGLDAPTGMILKQVKDYQDQYGFKLKGIELALRYFHETLGNPVREGDGIGIVIYVYEEAKKHWITKQRVAESLKDDLSQNPQEIIVDLNKKNKTSRGLIDISSL